MVENLRLPSERAKARVAKAQELKGIKEDKGKDISQVIGWIAQQEEGKIFLNWLMRNCGYNQPKVAFNMVKDVNGAVVASNISNEMTLYTAARESVYIDIRKHLDNKQLNNVENL